METALLIPTYNLCDCSCRGRGLRLKKHCNHQIGVEDNMTAGESSTAANYLTSLSSSHVDNGRSGSFSGDGLLLLTITEASANNSSLPNEVWINTFSYFSTNELIHTIGNVCKQFLVLSSDDSIWRLKCSMRWEGKQNVQRFRPKPTLSNVDDVDGSSSSSSSSNGRVDYCIRLLQYYHGQNNTTTNSSSFLSWLFRHVYFLSSASTADASVEGRDELLLLLNACPPVNMDQYQAALSTNHDVVQHHPQQQQHANHSSASSFVNFASSWKEAYIMAEIDSKRTIFTPEELIYCQWQLVYNGTPSSTGLRHFNPDGTYESPYMGISRWSLNYVNVRGEGESDEKYRANLRFSTMQVSLIVERNHDTWGWTVGSDEQGITYHSVDPKEEEEEEEED